MLVVTDYLHLSTYAHLSAILETVLEYRLILAKSNAQPLGNYWHLRHYYILRKLWLGN